MAEYHLIGVGGIGMSALARLLLERGRSVSGSDRAESKRLDQLREAGVRIDSCVVGAETTVVHSTAVAPDHPELLLAKERGSRVWHRSDLLLELMRGSRVLTVAGTHGKTTTSALLTWVLLQSGLDPSYALGGHLLGINGAHGSGDLFVAEADESDGSLVKYQSYAGILTGIEPDHMDHFGTKERLNEAFSEHVERVEHLFWCEDAPQAKGMSYGFSKGCDVRIEEWSQDGFSIRWRVDGVSLEAPLIGRHNVLNATAVFALARFLGVEILAIQRALATFPGVARRASVRGEVRSVLVLDDYAHHPTEVAATLEAVRKAARGRRVIACLQPHRYSRLRECMEAFSTSTSSADLLFLTEVYSAGEAPIEGVSSAALAKRIPGARLVARADLAGLVAETVRPHDIVVMMGAGDITGAAGDLVTLLEKSPPAKYKVAVLSGGRSSEHEVSRISAQNIAERLSTELYEVDDLPIGEDGDLIASGVMEALCQSEVVLPIFHGPHGEDGLFSALCEALGKPYVGPDFLSSAMAMDKGVTKRMAQSHGISTSPFVECTRTSRSVEGLRFPLMVKPSHLGSSIGIERAETKEELDSALDRVLELDLRAVVEEVIVGRELEFAVLGNEEISVAGPGEILTHGRIYDFEAKYGDEQMETTPRADLSHAKIEEGRSLAKRCYEALKLEGLSRIDFFLDEEGRWWLNEVNPIPGFTPQSLYPKMWEVEGLSYEKLLDRLILLALERWRR